MKIVFSKNNTHLILFFLSLLIFSIPNPIENTISFINLVRVTSLAFLLFFLLNRKYEKRATFKWLVCTFFILQIIEIVFSAYKYNQSIILTFALALGDISILGYFWLVQKWNDDSVVFIKNFLVRYVIFIAFYVILQYWIYKYLGISLLIPFEGKMGRIGTPRILYGGHLVFYGTIIAYGEVFRSINQHGFDWKIYKGDTCYYLAAIVGTYYLVLYNQTRGGLIAFALAVIVMLIVIFKSVKTKIIGLCIIIFVSIIVPNLSIVKNYIHFSRGETYSLDTRFDEIGFYITTGIESPIIGTGIIYSENKQYGWLLNGVNGRYFRNDVGVVGHFQKYGLCGSVWLLILFFKLWKIVKESRKTGELYEVRLATFLYILFSSPTLLLIETDNMYYFIPILLLFEQKESYELQKKEMDCYAQDFHSNGNI